MMTVMHNYPQHIRSVILDSALPGFVNYEEDALFTINEALNKVFSNCERDSTNKALINDLITGNQQACLKELFDDIFNSTGHCALGMRYSVYCSEQIAYAKQLVINKQNDILPYRANYPFNNVNHPLCSCWKVSPANASAKTPVYSNLPVLLSAGDTDPWCGTYYNDLAHHYMPNSQRLLFVNRTHGAALNTREEDILIAAFLEHPFQIVKPDGKSVITY
jgi:TAP-like protein